MDFKVRCVKAVTNCFTKGKIYEVIGGRFYDNHGAAYTYGGVGYSSKFELVEDKQMTKDDLKVGYVVERRDGALKMVMPTSDGTVFYGDGTYHREDAFNSDMINIYGTYKFDIVRVWGYTSDLSDTLIVTTKNRPLLWERKEEPIEITMQEIADWKGKPVSEIRIKE